MKNVKTKPNYDLSTALKLLVFQRILNPDSKLTTVESQVELFGDWNINLNALYRYLDKLDEIKNDLQLHLHQEISRLTYRESRLVFYDVTNYYFETDIPDEETITENGEIINGGLRRRSLSEEPVPNQLFNWVFLWIPMAFLFVTNYFVATKKTLLLIFQLWKR